MKEANKYYKHSGAIGFFSPILMTVFGAIAVALLGVIYGYAIYYIPFIYINFFITCFFGAGVGVMIGFGAVAGKSRNTAMIVLFGLIFGLLAAYAGWISKFYAISGQKALIYMPMEILNILQSVALKGDWSIFGWTPKGGSLYAIWGIEAGMIILLSMLTAAAISHTEPFCERCKKWIKNKESFSALAPVSNPDDLVKRMEQGDFSEIKSLGKSNSEMGVYTQVELSSCPICNNNHYVSVKLVQASKDSDGSTKKNETSLIDDLIISYDTYRMLKLSLT